MEDIIMYQHTVFNEYGEPIYIENIMDAQEQYEYDCDEEQRRADDPIYAQECEAKMWYNKALACFTQQGIEVPYRVVEILAEEMRDKAREEEKERRLKEVQPAVDFLNQHFPNTFRARYVYPTPDEIGYAYVEARVPYAQRPYKDEVMALLDAAYKQGICIDDYIYFDDLRKREKNNN